MESELSTEQFHKRLTELVTPEKTFSLFTHYDFSGKPFCGTYTNNSFELTKNSHWQHIKGMQIIGTFQSGKNNKTQVIFKVGMSNIWKWVVRILFITGLIALNTFLLMSNNFELSIFLTLNAWLVFMYLFGIATMKFSKFVVNSKLT
jgi:hypothetical protein